MEEQKKKTNKKLFFVIGVCVLLVGMFILLNTYAFWRIKGEQTESNYVVGACLEFNFIEEEDTVNGGYIGGFTLDDTWPMSDEEGIATPGYTFEIKNTCANDVNYQVILEKLSVANKTNEDYFADNLIKLQLNNGAITTYENLTDVTPEDVTYDNGQTTILEAAQLLTGTLAGNDTVRYNLRMWISDQSEVEDAGKVFRSKIKVFAGQDIPEPEYAITDESCFTFDDTTGTITDYDYATCGTESLVIPATIGGVIVKKIDLYSLNKTAWNQYYSYVDLSKATGLETIGQKSFFRYSGAGSNPKKLIIPDSVKTIEESALGNFDGSELVLGNSIETIGEQAFYRYGSHNSNKALVIPDSVKTIGNQAFYYFNGNNLTLNDGLLTIGDEAFHQYKGLDANSNKLALSIPDSVTAIGEQAFATYNGSTLTLSMSLQTMGDRAFGGYYGIGEDLVIPGTLGKINDNVFAAFRGDSITIENGPTEIGNSAFSSYAGIGATITIPNSVTTIGNSAFLSYSGDKLILGTGVQTIGNSAFNSFNGDGTLFDIPGNVTNIGNLAFSNLGCTSGTQVKFNEGLSVIGDSAFSNYNAGDFTLPSTITSIGSGAFYYFEGNISINMSSSEFDNVTKGNNWDLRSQKPHTFLQ